MLTTRRHIPCVLALLCSATAVGASRPAKACSGVYAYDVAGIRTLEVPPAGVVVAYYLCRYGYPELCDPPLTLTVTDEVTGEEVAGSVEIFPNVDDGADYVFRPTEPLEPDRIYLVENSKQGKAGQMGSFTVTSTAIQEVPSLELEGKIATSSTPEGDVVCCDYDSFSTPYWDSCTGPLEPVRDRFCFTPAWRRHLTLDVQLVAGQLPTPFVAHRILARTAAGQELAGPWHMSGERFVLLDQQDAYCFRAEVESLVDGTRWELPEQCVSHGDLPPLEVSVTDPSDFTHEFSECIEPPEQYEAYFCAGLAERCDEGDTDACERNARECGHDSFPEEKDSVGSDSEADFNATQPPPRDPRGCTTSPIVAGLGRGSILTSCLLLAAGLRRRRRPQ